MAPWLMIRTGRHIFMQKMQSPNKKEYTFDRIVMI